MFLLLRLICQILAAAIVVQASQSSSETRHPNALSSRFVRSRGLNATRVGSNLTVIDSATNLLQRVHLDLSADAIVQECDN